MARLVVCSILLTCFLAAAAGMPGETALRFTEPFFQPVGAVIIDPGHGGGDPGAVGRYQDAQGEEHDVLEKDVNLSVARMLKDMLQQRSSHLAVHMLRDDDRYLTLYRRVQLANAVTAAPGTSRIFISIHANAAPSPAARGFEVWMYRGRRSETFITPSVDDPAVEKLAAAVNASLHRQLEQAAEQLASCMIHALEEQVGERSPSRGVKHEEFYVIRHTMMPSVLIEAGFLSNPQEAALLVTSDYQEEIASALADAVIAYDLQMRQR